MSDRRPTEEIARALEGEAHRQDQAGWPGTKDVAGLLREAAERLRELDKLIAQAVEQFGAPPTKFAMPAGETTNAPPNCVRVEVEAVFGDEDV